MDSDGLGWTRMDSEAPCLMSPQRGGDMPPAAARILHAPTVRALNRTQAFELAGWLSAARCAAARDSRTCGPEPRPCRVGTPRCAGGAAANGGRVRPRRVRDSETDPERDSECDSDKTPSACPTQAGKTPIGPQWPRLASTPPGPPWPALPRDTSRGRLAASQSRTAAPHGDSDSRQPPALRREGASRIAQAFLDTVHFGPGSGEWGESRGS
jgi:hypothetical protein